MSFNVGDRVKARSGSAIIDLLPSTTGVVVWTGTTHDDGVDRLNVELDGGGIAMGTDASEWEQGKSAGDLLAKAEAAVRRRTARDPQS